MGSAKGIDVAAILAAAYRRPMGEADDLAARVKARLALFETLSECMRLLFEAPVSALASMTNTERVEPDRKGS